MIPKRFNFNFIRKHIRIISLLTLLPVLAMIFQIPLYSISTAKSNIKH